jgi:hypothetical protein
VATIACSEPSSPFRIRDTSVVAELASFAKFLVSGRAQPQ